MNERFALGRGDRADARRRWDDPATLDRIGAAFFVEEGDECFARRELGDRLFGVDFRIRAEGGRCGFHGLRVARRVRAQRVLNAIAKLAEHDVGHVKRILRDEIHADALGAHKTHHLLDA